MEVITNSGTIVNFEIQCIDTGDLYGISITYASKLVEQYTKQSSSYDDPKVISIWLIRDKIKHGAMADRMCPMDKISMCFEPNIWGGEYDKFDDKVKIIFVHLSKFKDEKLGTILYR